MVRVGLSVSDSLTRTEFFVSASLFDAMTDTILTPPCVFCGDAATRDITPLEIPPNERWYACDHCSRRFAVKFTPLPEPPKPS